MTVGFWHMSQNKCYLHCIVMVITYSVLQDGDDFFVQVSLEFCGVEGAGTPD